MGKMLYVLFTRKLTVRRRLWSFRDNARRPFARDITVTALAILAIFGVLPVYSGAADPGSEKVCLVKPSADELAVIIKENKQKANDKAWVKSIVSTSLDINNDGRPDIVYSEKSRQRGCGLSWLLMLNRGKGTYLKRDIFHCAPECVVFVKDVKNGYRMAKLDGDLLGVDNPEATVLYRSTEKKDVLQRASNNGRSAYVTAGRLDLVSTGEMKYDLRLRGKTIESYEYVYASIVGVINAVDGKDLVLMSTTLGGSGSGDAYSLLLITPDGRASSTGSFGTGRAPSIERQGQRITFSFPGNAKWVFENGRIKEIKTVHQSGLPDKDCRDIFNVYLEACVKEKMCHGGKRNFPMSFERDIMYYEGKLNEAAFDSFCSRGCTGKTASYPAFKDSVCARSKK